MATSRGISVMTIRLAGFACLVMLLIGEAATDLRAESRSLVNTKYTNGAAMRRLFVDVVSRANEWTVRIRVGDDVVAYGAVVREDGLILTKASQLNGDPFVRFADGQELPAEYLAYSAQHDLALLRVDATGLPSIQWQDEADPGVGGWVITPDQQGAPASVGVVSVTRREIPLVREPAVLGIQMRRDNSPVIVENVVESSAAELAGLRTNDIIRSVDDVTVTTPSAMKQEISQREPGDTVRLKVLRSDTELTLQATLTHPFGEFLTRIAMQNRMGGEVSDRRNGFPVALQHDSVLAPEQCGGPLVDLSGKAIGINIARAGRTASYAIPDDVVRPLIAELLSGKYPAPGEPEPTVASDLVDEPGNAPHSDTSGMES